MLDTLEVINIGLLTAEARVVSAASFEGSRVVLSPPERAPQQQDAAAAARLVNTAVRQRFILTVSIMNSLVQNVDC